MELGKWFREAVSASEDGIQPRSDSPILWNACLKKGGRQIPCSQFNVKLSLARMPEIDF